jgi:hypothetical protein
VAALRKRAEIVLVDVNRQPPNSAARPFPVGSHSLGRCCHVVSLHPGIVHAKPFSRREWPRDVGGGVARQAMQALRAHVWAGGRGRGGCCRSAPAVVVGWSASRVVVCLSRGHESGLCWAMERRRVVPHSGTIRRTDAGRAPNPASLFSVIEGNTPAGASHAAKALTLPAGQAGDERHRKALNESPTRAMRGSR